MAELDDFKDEALDSVKAIVIPILNISRVRMDLSHRKIVYHQLQIYQMVYVNVCCFYLLY